MGDIQQPTPRPAMIGAILQGLQAAQAYYGIDTAKAQQKLLESQTQHSNLENQMLQTQTSHLSDMINKVNGGGQAAGGPPQSSNSPDSPLLQFASDPYTADYAKKIADAQNAVNAPGVALRKETEDLQKQFGEAIKTPRESFTTAETALTQLNKKTSQGDYAAQAAVAKAIGQNRITLESIKAITGSEGWWPSIQEKLASGKNATLDDNQRNGIASVLGTIKDSASQEINDQAGIHAGWISQASNGSISPVQAKQKLMTGVLGTPSNPGGQAISAAPKALPSHIQDIFKNELAKRKHVKTVDVGAAVH